MPPIAAIGAAIAASSIATSIAINVALAIGMSLLGRLLAPKPEEYDAGAFSVETKDRQHIVRSSIQPRRMIYGRVRASGTLVYVDTVSNKTVLIMVIVLSAHQVQEFEEIWLNDDRIDDKMSGDQVVSGRYANRVRLDYQMGTDDQLASPIALESPNWTAEHRCRGCATLNLRMVYDQDTFPTGIPTPRVVLKGKADILDPRTSTTGYTDNAALCALDYIRSPLGIGAAADEWDDLSWRAAADVCEQQVPTTGTETEARYTCNGAFSLDRSPIDVLEDLLSAMAGRAVPFQGQWRAWAASPTAPTGNPITLAIMRGPIRVRARHDRASLFNTIRGTYIEPGEDWQRTDFPPISETPYITEDNGETIWRDIALPFTISRYMAARIATVELARHRQQISHFVPVNFAGLNYAPMQVVTVDNPSLGWNGKEFRVVGRTIAEDGAIDLELREEAAAIYDWTADQIPARDPAPDTELRPGADVDPPTGLVVDSGENQVYRGANGVVLAAARLFWSPPNDGLVIGYDVEYKRTADTEWEDAGSPSGAAVSQFIAPVDEGVSYDFRVRARNTMKASPWTTLTDHVIVGATALPPDVTTFLLKAQADGTREFRWTLSNPPPDLAGYNIRYGVGLGLPAEQLVIELNDQATLLTGSPWERNHPPAGDYTFGIWAVDTGGRESANPNTISASLPANRIPGRAFEYDVRQAGWPGTKTDMHVNRAGSLELVGTDTWANLPMTLPYEWQKWTTGWRTNYNSPAYYEEEVNVGNGQDFTFTPLLELQVEGCGVVPEFQWAPAGGAFNGTWTESPGPITAERVKFRLTITPTSVACYVHQCVFIASAAVVEVEVNDVNSATLPAIDAVPIAGRRRLPVSGQITQVLTVSVTLQNMGAGATWELIDKDSTVGPGIAIWTAATPSDGTIDYLVRGLV